MQAVGLAKQYGIEVGFVKSQIQLANQRLLVVGQKLLLGLAGLDLVVIRALHEILLPSALFSLHHYSTKWLCPQEKLNGF